MDDCLDKKYFGYKKSRILYGIIVILCLIIFMLYITRVPRMSYYY